MKTCLTTLYVFCCIIVVLSLSCSKRDVRQVPDEFFLDARSYFESSVLPGSQGGTKIAVDQLLLEKSPNWKEARIQELPRGKTVVVPLKHKDTTQYATVIGGTFKCPLDKIGYLLLSKDKGHFRAEVIYKIPDTARVTEKFSGIVLIETWDGRFLDGYRYRNDSVFRVSTQLLPGGLQTNSWQTTCEEVDWYTCAYSANTDVYCNYSHTTKHCIDNPDNGSGTPTGGGVGGAGGGAGTPVYPGRTPADSDPATRPRREPTEPTGKLDICKKSFVFKKVISLDPNGFGGWQIAAVSNVHMNLVDPGDGVLKIVRPGPVLYFGFPIVRSNKTFYSTARAAELAVEIDNKALLDVMARYHSGKPIDWEGMNALYREKLNEYAKQYGGRVTLSPGIGNLTEDLPVTPAKYSGIAGIGCL
ncbi:hypothetical protein HF324_27600 [Chitinophaga oryzae]|uniref:Uncharacterized protein n=1 Tax=Chitinophaga oryzae TaxID=2725414 RepID=A0AAE7DAF1_9BACT|nr:hypothetical protein [Chitinophaga oryzae]QJB34890.1 hypothetical protein HF329_27740 [Chitinophaga oryzae]QJB41401.1 hypothetical protein HF324_27600 [Chitinophaga oryzae]